MKLCYIGAAVLLAHTACAPPVGVHGAQRDPLRITRHEISESLATDAYEAVRKLRANFLASRGPTSLRMSDSRLPAVFVDGLPFGSATSLRLIPAGNVAEIRLFRAWEATTVFGTGYMSGVIAVTTRR